MSERKQVILFMTDTTRKDMLGCYGDSRMITPNLDRLAQEGIRYENAYSCQPVCGPARGAIFTGMFPHSNGVSTNSMPLGEGVKTIGQRLTDQQIHCGIWMVAIISAMENVRKAGIRSTGMICGAIWKS